MIKISLKDLSKERESAIMDFAKEFGLSLADDGAQIVCRASDELTAEYDGKTLIIGTRGDKGFFRALSLSADMPKNKPFSLREQYGLRDLGLMIDCSRNAAPMPETIKKLIRYMAALGYTSLQLYMEDMFEVEGEPFFGYLRGRYSQQDLRVFDEYAALFGIELIPCVQTLAHFTAPMRWEKFSEGKHDINDILLVGEEKTYEFIEKIFAVMRTCFRSANIHIGMDEAHMLGLGKYLDKHGYENRFGILCRHLERVAALAEKYGFTPMMWSDMFFRLAFGGEYCVCGGSVPEEVRAKVPKNVKLVYWDYYSRDESRYDDMFRAHKEFAAHTVFAGGFWKWCGFTPHNGFTLAATNAALNSAKRYGIDEAFFTMWGDNGAECPLFALLPSMVATAENVYGHGGDEKWLLKRFKILAGMGWEDFMSLDLPDVLEDDLCDLCNPSKYLLYNDCLMGIFDCTVKEKDSEKYVEYVVRLQQSARNKKWGYEGKIQEVKVIDDTEEETVTDEPVIRGGDVEQINEPLAEETKELPEQDDEVFVSPVYRQYLEAQKINPQAVVLQRVGDFYEVMGENARAVAEELDLTLTSRDVGLPERVPMCGFPYHVTEVYMSATDAATNIRK